jgi:hypothetical protein
MRALSGAYNFDILPSTLDAAANLLVVLGALPRKLGALPRGSKAVREQKPMMAAMFTSPTEEDQ